MKRQKKINWGKLAVFVTVVLLAAGLIAWLLQSRGQKPGLTVYFVRGDELVPVSRPIKADIPFIDQSLSALLAGPNEEERDQGLTTHIPAGVKIKHIKLERKMIIVDLSRELESYGGGSARLEGMIAQIIYTATAVPGIEKAWIWLEGEKEVVLGGEGFVLDRPIGRGDLKN